MDRAQFHAAFAAHKENVCMMTFRIAVFSAVAAAAVGAVTLPTAARAQFVVNETITSVGSLFQYNYTVANKTPNDVLILTLGNIPTGPNAVQNLAFPTGFQGAYDSGLNLVSFLPDLGSSSTFAAGTTLSGFSFQSPFAPIGTTFSTFDANGNSVSGSAVPEPGVISLAVGLALSGAGLRRRSRKNRA